MASLVSNASTVPDPCLYHSRHRSALLHIRPWCATYTFRPLPSIRGLPRLHHHHHHHHHRLRISAEASTSPNGGLDDLASQLADGARNLRDQAGRALEDAWLRAVGFVESQDIQGRLQQSFRAANQKLEEVGYDMRKNAEKLNRQFRLSQRVQEMVDFAGQQVKNVDQQLGLAQKFRTASSDFSRNWPMYRRQIDQFLRTPLGKTFTTLVFLWFLLSGWLFRIIFFSMWMLPLAAPLLMSTAARNMVVEGACPSCKRRFIGNRNQMILCNYCRAVVWQPRQDFSKDKSDPSIIDVDIEP